MDAEVFWSKVKQRLNELDKRQDWLCEKSGMLLQSMRNQISTKRLPSLEDAMNIVDTLGFTWDEFCQYPDGSILLGKESTHMIPVMEQAFSAGKGQFVPDYAEVKEYIAVPSSLKRYGDNLQAAYVRGDSMEPTLSDGDTIICDNNGYDGRDGIYTILYKGSGYVKRLQRTAEGVKIISDNPLYSAMTENSQSEDFTVIGRVHYVLHEI